MEIEIFAPFTGKVVPLEDVPDEAFAKKMLGDGVAILPSDGKFVAPIESRVFKIFETHHAYILTNDKGIDILIHIGIDTVELKGEGFKNFVKISQKLNKGDLVSEIDINLIVQRGYNLHTPIIFTASEKFNSKFCYGDSIAGVTKIANFRT